jgi:hypothetical protein
VIEHDFRVRECTGKVRDIVKLRVKNQSIERESETAEDRGSTSRNVFSPSSPTIYPLREDAEATDRAGPSSFA